MESHGTVPCMKRCPGLHGTVDAADRPSATLRTAQVTEGDWPCGSGLCHPTERPWREIYVF